METQVKLDELTAEQRSALMAELKQHEETKKQKIKDDRTAYAALVDETIDQSMEDLVVISGKIGRVKIDVLERFRRAIDMKGGLFVVKDNQKCHTFTNSLGNKRIRVGYLMNDNYRDTVNEGLAIVKECVMELGTDDKSRALVNIAMKLMSKDQKGGLKPSRVIQLRNMAEDTNNQRLIDGVRIIEDAYQPIESKLYIRAEYKNAHGVWVSVPLGMTEAG